MKKSQATFQIICQSLCESPTFSNAARAAGISESTLYSWFGASQRGEASCTLDTFHGDRDVPLHTAAKQCRKLCAAAIVQNLEHRARHGDLTDSLFRGQRVFELDQRYLDWSDEDFRALGIDVGLRYKRDDRGLPIPVRVWTPPPVALALAVASAHWPRLYGSHSEVSLNVRGNLGVTTVAAKALPQVTVVAAAAAAIAPPPVDQGDDDLSDLLDGPEAEAGEFTEYPDIAPEDVMEAPAAPAPAPTTPTRWGNLTSEQIAIANRISRGMKVC